MSKKNQLLEKELPSETSENKEFIENKENLTTENTLQNSEGKNTTDEIIEENNQIEEIAENVENL